MNLTHNSKKIKIKCPKCQGTGRISIPNTRGIKICPKCNGQRIIYQIV